MKHIKHKRFSKIVLCFLCVLLALSFLAALVPIASASLGETMPCCAGKAAGHCDSGLAPKKAPPRTSEPMCGLDNSAAADDANTIVAEPVHNHSQSSSSGPAAQSLSVNHPCRMDCGACATSSSRQQRRDRSILEPISSVNALVVAHARVETSPVTVSSNENREQTSPRGPPPVR